MRTTADLAAQDSVANGIQMTRKAVLPYFVAGVVVRGFGRGSKELGIPTANFEQKVVDELPDELECGVYYGWAQVVPLPEQTTSSSVHKMVASIGWNPFYHNEKKSMEAHLMNRKDQADFYGSLLKVAIAGYIRTEQNFTCKEELMEAIRQDLTYGSEALDSLENVNLSNHPFFALDCETKPRQQNGFDDSS